MFSYPNCLQFGEVLAGGDLHTCLLSFFFFLVNGVANLGGTITEFIL